LIDWPASGVKVNWPIGGVDVDWPVGDIDVKMRNHYIIDSDPIPVRIVD
jgi:hypothetical protein